MEFHEIICALTDNKRLIQMLLQLKEHIFRYRLEYIKEMKDKKAIVEEHNRIIDAIAEKDAKKASREIKSHIEIQEKYILNTLLKE